MTLRDHIAAVLANLGFTGDDEHYMADAILADPLIAAIIDFAADSVEQRWYSTHLSPEVRALLRRDREPQPSDGPDYHADHAAWRDTVEEREFAKRVELND